MDRRNLQANEFDVDETPVNSMFATRLPDIVFTGVSATSNTFTYTTVSADTSNRPEQFNVILTDAVSETVNSVYSSTFTIDPALTTPTTPVS